MDARAKGIATDRSNLLTQPATLSGAGVFTQNANQAWALSVAKARTVRASDMEFAEVT
jgi:hypothetical protein